MSGPNEQIVCNVVDYMTVFPEGFLTIAEAAQKLGITRQRVHKLIQNGQLQAVRVGKFYLVSAKEIEVYLAQPQGKPYSPRKAVAGNSIDKRQHK